MISVFNEAFEFINHYLYDCRPWSKDNFVQYERGAWARCYGIPIHAWNNGFFVELVSVLGTLLKIDNQTLHKERFDFSRLLITTKILK